LIKPYAGPLLSVLLRTASAKDTNPAVASYCLACLGELARVGGEEISPSVDKIMALIMEMLADQTSSLKRDAALKTLGQVASNTGAVIEPYQKYPHLLAMLMRFLKTEKSQNIRRETIRTMGMLGALDPYRHKVSTSWVNRLSCVCLRHYISSCMTRLMNKILMRRALESRMCNCS
jgi:FKBP12-rapamycin complex-associated protein